MSTKDDWDLLEAYARHRSEEAFAELVARHVNLVYSAACRQLGQPQLAEEATQAVFIILAQKAGRLRRDKSLAGWLYQTSWLTAANLRRAEFRRARREQESLMEPVTHEPDPGLWTQIAPVLDEAMAALGDQDRHAIVMRYFEGREFKDLAATLGTSENAVKMRLSRAVEKLRRHFAQRGVAIPTAALASLLAAQAVQAAPVGLAATVLASAVQVSTVSASTLTLAKGTLKIMAYAKAKTIAVTGVAALIATTLLVHHYTTGSNQARLSQVAPAIDQIRAINPDQALAQGKALIFSSFALRQVPAAARWCETLNGNGKLWPVTPTNTVFALNAKAAGLAISTLPGDLVVFFETPKTGWNVAGGAELFTAGENTAAVAFANGQVLQVSGQEASSLRWAP